MQGLVEVAPIPPVPLLGLLTYAVPEPLRARIAPGMRVRMPLGNHLRTGVVAGFAESAPTGHLRPILDVLDADPFLPAELLELCRWTARYYLVSLADVIGAIVPATVPEPPRERIARLVRRVTAEEEARLQRRAPAQAEAYRVLAAAPGGAVSMAAARRDGVRPTALRALRAAGVVEVVLGARAPSPPPPPPLAPALTPTAAQSAAIEAIAGAVGGGEAVSFLLHGITGSGKTEVFLAAARATLEADRDVVLLVPEIALTHQLVERVRGRFGPAAAVLHSGLGPRERWNEWRRIRSREARVVVGARSAVFAPVGRLGLVVVDEEHDA